MKANRQITATELPSWALPKLNETHPLCVFYSSLKQGEVKKDLPTIHLQETATEAGAEVTQDLYSSVPGCHLITPTQEVKKNPTAWLQGNTFSSPCTLHELVLQLKLGLLWTIWSSVQPDQCNHRVAAVRTLIALTLLVLVLTKPGQDTAQPPSSGVGQMCSRSPPPSSDLQQAERSFTKKKSPPNPYFLGDHSLRHNSHFTFTRFAAPGLKKIYNILILLF